jgi:hypothetical protein
MTMTMTEVTVKYEIPICVEKAKLGMFRSVEVKDNEVIIRFDVLQEQIEIPPQQRIVFDNGEKAVDFS